MNQDRSLGMLAAGVMLAIALPAAILTSSPGWVTAASVNGGVLAWLVARRRSGRSSAEGPTPHT